MSSSTWKFDPAHTSIDFRIRHAAISWVKGTFREWSGSIDFDPDHPERVFTQLTVDLSSVDTGVKDRDDHLRSGDFFDVANYPEMTFASTDVTSHGGERYRLAGDLMLHGVSKRVIFDVAFCGVTADPWGVTRAGFEASAVIDRRDWGLIWNQTMESAGVLVGDTVEVTIEAEVVKG